MLKDIVGEPPPGRANTATSPLSDSKEFWHGYSSNAALAYMDCQLQELPRADSGRAGRESTIFNDNENENTDLPTSAEPLPVLSSPQQRQSERQEDPSSLGTNFPNYREGSERMLGPLVDVRGQEVLQHRKRHSMTIEDQDIDDTEIAYTHRQQTQMLKKRTK